MLGRFFSKLGTHPEPKFILELAFLALVLKALFLFLTGLVLNLVGLAHLVDFANETQAPPNNLADFIFVVLIAPLIETIFGQWLPITLTSKLIKSGKGLMVASASVFTLFHYPAVAFFPGAFVIGLILAWVWLLKGREGWWKAFWVTTSIHALHNFFAYLLGRVIPE